jgi:hypothetical protein
LAFELGEFRSHLTVATNKECRRPEHDDSGSDSDLVVRSLGILRAGNLGSARRYPLGFLRELLTGMPLYMIGDMYAGLISDDLDARPARAALRQARRTVSCNL